MENENREMVQLNEEELVNACGGFSEQNGLYSLKHGDIFLVESGDRKETWTINEDYEGITLDSRIRYYWTCERNGMYYDSKQCDYGTLKDIFRKIGVRYVGNEL